MQNKEENARIPNDNFIINSFKEIEILLQKDFLGKHHFKALESLLFKLHAHPEREKVQQNLSMLRKKYPVMFSSQTMQGAAYAKTHGYAGDFEIIDKIYTKWVSGEPSLQQWDHYFHNQAAPKAVRNRKSYFTDYLKSFADQHEGKMVEVLNLASGPGRDIYELFQEKPTLSIAFDCVDMDANAIDYAKQLLEPHIHCVHFIQQNIYRFTPTKAYDLIWSAGLFDYFDDLIFEKVLARLIYSSKLGAQLIIGNFSENNPTRPYMELIGDWYLHHRTPAKLFELAVKAGADPSKIYIDIEEEGVNLFLHIKI